ncbi:MAG: hypothetical protein J6J87_05855 [Oscillospiraceae bacterium]|nr:hypothetical protein [Oscillospiraceae bacterium]
MKEDSGRILEAMDHLDPALIEDMDGQATAKRRPAPVRVLLAAACICALLVTAAVAAEALGFDFVKIFSFEKEGKQVEGYRADGSGIVYIPLKDLSPEVQALEGQYADEYIHTERLSFDSWEEAEEYLGYEIVDHPVLRGADYIRANYSIDGVPVTGNCNVTIDLRGGEVFMITVQSSVRKYPSSFTMTATLYVGGPLPDQTEDPGFGYFSHVETVEEQEDYLTANNIETVIVCMEHGDMGNGTYHANFFLRGIRFSVRAGFPNPERQQSALSKLKQDLDAFE